MSARRNALRDIDLDSSPTHLHAGLWFDKYLKEHPEGKLESHPYFQHIKSTGKIRESPTYRAFFDRWQAELRKMKVQTREAKVVGRLAAGLGGASVIENGMTFHRTYGVPIIPGSSLKGTARAYAVANLAEEWGKGGKAFRTLFGGQVIPPGEKPEEKARVGIAIFYDALPVPGTFAIHNEIMTVHHREYYQAGEKPPADWDSPTPIPFASVSGQFLIALSGDYPIYVNATFNILESALEHDGVGGKTSSGFGRLQMVGDNTNAGAATSETGDVAKGPEQTVIGRFQRQLDALSHADVAGQIHSIYVQWREAELTDTQRQEVARRIIAKVRDAKREKKSKKKGWYQELLSAIPEEQD